MKNKAIALEEALRLADHAFAQRDVAEARIAGVLDALAELVRTTRFYSGQPSQQSALSHAEALLVANGRRSVER